MTLGEAPPLPQGQDPYRPVSWLSLLCVPPHSHSEGTAHGDPGLMRGGASHPTLTLVGPDCFPCPEQCVFRAKEDQVTGLANVPGAQPVLAAAHLWGLPISLLVLWLLGTCSCSLSARRFNAYIIRYTCMYVETRSRAHTPMLFLHCFAVKWHTWC